MTKLPQYHYDDSFDLTTIPRDIREINGKIHLKSLNKKPSIGPHEGRALSLILLGKKALHIHARPHILKELKIYIDSQQLIVQKEKYHSQKEASYTICRADCIHYIEEAKSEIKQIQYIMRYYYRRLNKISENKLQQLLSHERKLGQLLGYFDRDIEVYCERRALCLRNGE